MTETQRKQRNWPLRHARPLLPITLIDASTPANAARDIRILAIAIDPIDRCARQHITIAADQLLAQLSPADYITANPQKPAPTGLLPAEATTSTPPLSESTVNLQSPGQPT